MADPVAIREPSKFFRYVTNLGVFLGIVAGIIKIAEYVHAPSAGLRARITSAPFVQPPAEIEFREKLSKAVKADAIVAGVDFGDVLLLPRRVIVAHVRSYVARLLLDSKAAKDGGIAGMESALTNESVEAALD